MKTKQANETKFNIIKLVISTGLPIALTLSAFLIGGPVSKINSYWVYIISFGIFFGLTGLSFLFIWLLKREPSDIKRMKITLSDTFIKSLESSTFNPSKKGRAM